MCFLQIVSRWDFEAHHFLGSGGQLEARFALSTDDVCGDFFESSLREEYALVAKAFWIE